MPPTDQNVLELIELTKVYKDFWGRETVQALSDLDLDVKQGEVFGLLGPNGSGKTTGVRLILGLLFPTRGAVRLFGKPPRRVDVKKRVGYMPEESNLYPYLTAEETLDFFGRLFHLGRAERRERTDALIDMVGLNRARKRPVGQFSKGMARRVGLAQALINDPDFLILDEPTTGLDPIGSREMKDLILTLRDRGKTIFLCSHLLSDVEEICDRVCILYGGKQRAEGSVDELLTAHDVTQIRAPALKSETVAKIRDLIRKEMGGDGDVQVSSPTKKLEEYFLDVVRQARRERLSTAGAELGTGTAQFLGGEEQEGDQLLRDLVEAGREAEATGEEPEADAEPAAALEAEVDEDLLNELVELEGEEAPSEPASEEPESAVGPAPGVREDALQELLDEQDAEAEAGEGSDEEQTG
ncbi:MAG: ABC transporter ATP-binding protein [Planctomycetota bacterium]